MQYVLCEASEVREQPEFSDTLADLEQMMGEVVARRWPGFTYGRFTPMAGQEGRTTIHPMLFEDLANSVLGGTGATYPAGYAGVALNGVARNHFRQYYQNGVCPAAACVTPGWNTILQGPTAGVMLEDYMVAWCGLAFPEQALLCDKIRWEIGDTRYPIVDIEELLTYQQPCIIFEEGFIIEEENFFQLRGWLEDDGWQRIMPLGFMVYKRKDNVITE